MAKKLTAKDKEEIDKEHQDRIEAEALEQVEMWQQKPRLNLIIAPLNTDEPDVQAEATQIFLELRKKIAAAPTLIQEEIIAVDARRIAMILHGYYREQVDPESEMGIEWDIYIQFQTMPISCETFTVVALNEEEAERVAQEECKEKHKHAGLVLAINGVARSDSQ